MQSVLRVFGYLRRYPVLGGAQLACAVFMALSVVIFPAVAEIILDEVIPNPARHGQLIFWVLVGLLGFFRKNTVFDKIYLL